MSDSSEKQLGSSDYWQEIDARREEFEQAWKAGQTPRLEDYLLGVAGALYEELIRELLTVELEHRQDSEGNALSEEKLTEQHPRLATELGQAFEELRALGTKCAGRDDQTIRLPASAADQQRTIDHSRSRKDSHGLHIRCPHCSNPVELLADTPYDDISCSTCGSMFNLVDREEATQMAAPLKRLGRFDLISRLGVGGFGTVWKARDRELDRVVAIKMPRRGQLGPDEIEQFFREARSAAQLRHPNIVPVHEVGREEDTIFIVSDIIRGVALSDWLTGRRPTPLHIADLCAKVAGALAHAHDKGVIHRDMKPSNIMIDEAGEPHLMDFGLAKREVGEVTMTVEGQILGTPAYMSPEQARGESHWIDRRTDIYSMGVMLFEMLTGEKPFRGNHQMQIHARLIEDPPDPRKFSRHIPRDLATICLKCMERAPGARYSTAGELRDEFQRFINGEPIVARPISAPARAIRWMQRKPLLATTAALVAFLAIAGPLTALVINQQRSRLAGLVAEKNNLIEGMTTDKQQDTSQIDALSGRLDVWEGRANPWDFWPPQQGNPPRRKVIEKLFEHASAALANQGDNTNDGDQARARGTLALAIMADAMDNRAEAATLYQEANDLLESLRDQSPDQPQFARAMAECDTALSRLAASDDRTIAQEHLSKAHDSYEQLVTAYPEEVDLQVEWLEAKLNSATLAGFEPGREYLKQVAEIYRSLPEQLPNEPDAIYRLACFLTHREPLLDTRPTAPND